MQFVQEPARRTEVVSDVDVLVAGGGIAGVAAAVCAARRGAEVLIVERYGYLGGVTVGWPVPVLIQYGRPDQYFVQGFGRELIDRLDELGGWIGPDEPESRGDGLLDTELLRLVLAEKCREAGVEVLLHSWIVDAVTEDDAVRGVIVENKSGRQALTAEVVVDATGDADVAALAGAAMLQDEDPEAVDEPTGQAVGKCSFRADPEGVDTERFERFKEEEPERYEELMEQVVAAGGVKELGGAAISFRGDAVDVRDLTRMEMEGSRQALVTLEFFRQNVPGWENATIGRLADQFGVRYGRRIAGLETLTKEHVKEARRTDQDIARFHAGGEAGGIPYGCLVPRSVDGLIIGSRSISVEEAAFGSIRLIGTAWALGEAAGTAAALAQAEGIEPRYLDVARLRAALKDQGALV